jgi:hypothetical protein
MLLLRGLVGPRLICETGHPMKLRVLEKHFHTEMKARNSFSDLERLNYEIAFQHNEMKSKRKC